MPSSYLAQRSLLFALSEYPFIVELNIPSHSAPILITAAKDIAEQKEANLTFRIRYACRDTDAKQHWSHNGTFCALARRYVIAGPQTVLTMSLLANRRARLAKDIFPTKPSADWHQNDETRHELEKLYAEWGLDIRWLRGERSHVRAAPSRKKRLPRAKSRRVKQSPIERATRCLGIRTKKSPAGAGS